MERPLGPLDIVNTCGAGDTFCAGLIHSIVTSSHVPDKKQMQKKSNKQNPNEYQNYNMLSGIRFGMKYAEKSLQVPTAVPPQVDLQDLLDELN